MAAVANNPKFAKKVGISQSVGEDFIKADKGRKFNRGGEMKESKKMVGKEIAFMKKKGAPKSMVKHEMAEAKGMKKGGTACGGMKKYAKGGAIDGVATKGKTKGTMITMAKGGMAKKGCK